MRKLTDKLNAGSSKVAELVQLLTGVSALPLKREAIRIKPTQQAAGDAAAALLADATDERIVKKGAYPRAAIRPEPAVPTGTVIERLKEVTTNPDKYASSGYSVLPPNDPLGDRAYSVSYNPNADVSLLAHELGHVITDRTKIGRIINDARHNDNLKQALKAAMLIAPGAVSTLTPGDEDTAAAITTGVLLNAPTILNEGLATKNALAIMNDVPGMRAGLGQRAKLAGGLLSYIAAPAAIALGGNVAGNYLDDFVYN